MKMKRFNLATILCFWLFIWKVDAAKFGSLDENRILTSKTASFATIDEPVSIGTTESSETASIGTIEPDSIGTREASTHNGNQNRNAAYPTMTTRDLY